MKLKLLCFCRWRWWLLVVLVVAAQPVAAESAAEEANIAKITAAMLQSSHFAAHRDGHELSAKFLDHYLDILDPAHVYFLESDVTEFASYRANLEELTLKSGDISPAQKIFERYLERLEQRVTLAKELLQQMKFTFNGKDTLLIDREHAPRPADIKAASLLWGQQLRYEYLQEKLNKKKPAAIVETLTKRYDRTLRTMKQFSADQVFETYLNALARVYDPHSDYLGRRQLEEFNIAMKLSLCGIGAVLRFDDGYCKIHELMPGGPAATSGLLKPGDRIVAVAQEGKEPVDVIEMPLTETVQMIRGPKGTKVSLTLISTDAADTSVRRTIHLVRDEIKIESQQAKGRVVDLPDAGGQKLRIGVINLPSFYVGDRSREVRDGAAATDDVAKILAKLKKEKVQGIILDLRLNGGGSLEEAIRLTGLFIEFGPVVQVKDAHGKVQVARDPDPSVLYDGPLVVLTSRVSASASEILAGALQDYGRAVIVGDSSTFGKGTVQSMIDLGPIMQRNGLDGGDNPGALKLTTSKFYRPSGSSTQLKGVVPDIILPSPFDAFKVGEAIMPESLPWDETSPSVFFPVKRVAAYVPSLRKTSTERIRHDPEFIWLREDLERVKKQRENPVVSLNEGVRREEIVETEARQKSRQQIRAKRPAIGETDYEITVKNAGTPGLPAPVSTVSTNSALSEVANDGDGLDPHKAASADKTPPTDYTLGEAKRILADYIHLLANNPVPSIGNETVQTK